MGCLLVDYRVETTTVCQTWRSLQSAIEKRELSQLLSLIYYPRSRYTLRYASSVRHISKISTWVLLQILKKGSFRLHTHARKSSARKARVYPIQTHLKKQRKERHQRSKRKTSLHPLGLDRRTWSWRTLNYVQVQQRWKCQEGLYISSVFSFTLWKSAKM